MELTAEDLTTTAFGTGAVTRIGGLKDGTLQLEFHQDFGADSVDATLFPLLGTTVTFLIVPTSAVVSETNPSYAGNCLVTTYSPFASATGDLATLSVSWPVSGPVTRAVA